MPQAAAVTQAPRELPFTGADVLGWTRGFLDRYGCYPSGAALDAITLWAMHAHYRDEAGRLALAATPRLLLMSSQPGSGKLTVLEMLNVLCPWTYGLDSEPTAAGLAHSIDKEHATVLLDEADVLLGAGRRKEAVRAVINAGYTPNGSMLRMRGSKAERVKVFGPLALAGLDVMAKRAGTRWTRCSPGASRSGCPARLCSCPTC